MRILPWVCGFVGTTTQTLFTIGFAGATANSADFKNVGTHTNDVSNRPNQNVRFRKNVGTTT
ncbi:hypothetical protein LFX25_10880 [Leptospira sp. FAT2]|uniref:hypothetical protein n=1 Tax=Leptospira sanjuanensis TaxID=2879643 RepID=UPI001EE82A1A|nr:hypothetical protein [Leptospira sanjuanensis]MCG6168329.1 hypothetical protein [Leptospira sanjuanensis]MCG6193747.1 hypothetical protein [Leptospira sanjuanensis]